jgi:leucyl/phenylalanyl-tRNA---protein transferase
MAVSLGRLARRAGRPVKRVALPAATLTEHYLDRATEVLSPRARYSATAPATADLLANYMRGYVLFGCPGSRFFAYEWRSFPVRAIITPETASVPKRLRPIQRRGEFEIRIDQDFEEIIQRCTEGRDGWLTPGVIGIYREAYKQGFVATVGSYRAGQLAGGLWGISIGPVFGLMSMFHRADHAGALAMAALAEQVSGQGRWSLVDCGLLNPNFARYGAAEVGDREFCDRLWGSLNARD